MRRSITLYGLSVSLPIFIWQLLFFVAPLIFLVTLSFWSVRNFRIEPDFILTNWLYMLGRSVFWDAYLRTFALATMASILTSCLAFPCSYAIAFKLSPTLQRSVIFMMVIPFFTSYLVRIYSWQIFLSDHGIINALMAQMGLGPYSLLNSLFGLMVGYMSLSFPLVVLLQLSSLAFIDKNLIEAAHNLRCGRIRTIFTIIIPSAKTGLIIASLFCFILTFGDFVSPLYLGGGDFSTLSILITDTTKSGQQWPRAAVIALVMITTLLTVAFGAIRLAYRERGR